MARAYQKLGLKDSYNDTLRLIEANFPHELKRLEKS